MQHRASPVLPPPSPTCRARHPPSPRRGLSRWQSCPALTQLPTSGQHNAASAIFSNILPFSNLSPSPPPSAPVFNNVVIFNNVVRTDLQTPQPPPLGNATRKRLTPTLSVSLTGKKNKNKNTHAFPLPPQHPHHTTHVSGPERSSTQTQLSMQQLYSAGWCSAARIYAPAARQSPPLLRWRIHPPLKVVPHKTPLVKQILASLPLQSLFQEQRGSLMSSAESWDP